LKVPEALVKEGWRMASKSLRLPKVGHIGTVVKNIDRVIEYYSPVFGIGPFEIYDFRPYKAWVHGQEVRPFELKIATADVGSAKMELIQVIRGEPPHRDFLEVHGEGLQHLGFYVENYDEWKSYVREEGIGILCEIEAEDQVRGNRRAFYMNSGEIGGVLFEIIERQS
jgi:catechol 2,3-dioxygenase-like lactoylglutathione lyase family enzyme